MYTNRYVYTAGLVCSEHISTSLDPVLIRHSSNKDHYSKLGYGMLCSELTSTSLDLFLITGEGHVEKVFVVSQLAKSDTDVALEVVPPQAKLFTACHLQFFALLLDSF